MILSVLLAISQAPAVLQVRLLLPVGTLDRGIPMRIVSESSGGRNERTSFSDGLGSASFHVEGAVARDAGPWSLWVGETEEPNVAPMLLTPGSARELIVDLRGYAFPVIREDTSGWNALVEILDSRSLRVLGSDSPPAYAPFPVQREWSWPSPGG